MVKKILQCFLIFLITSNVVAQNNFLTPSDTLNHKRVRMLNIGCAIGYSASMYGLNTLWYNQYPRSGFHFFDDRREWLDMDKAGHFTTAYEVANILSTAYGWAGMNRRKSIIYGTAIGTIFQTTIEVLDGFSSEWGFSISDFTSNTAGSALFIGQELLWRDQRIVLKISNMPRTYPNTIVPSTDGSATTTIANRATDLYGTLYPQTFFKDYNAAIYWASFNINSFTGKSKVIPNWLNIAIGYSGENMFGGYKNEWKNKDGAVFILDPIAYPRYRQYFLSLDIDLSRVKTKSRFVNSLLRFVSYVKIPAPSLEYSQDGFKFHPLMW